MKNPNNEGRPPALNPQYSSHATTTISVVAPPINYHQQHLDEQVRQQLEQVHASTSQSVPQPPPYPGEAPPSYDSIFGRVREAREQAGSNPFTFCSRICDIFCGTIGALLWLAFVLAIPAALIFVGYYYWHDCTINEWIPRWLVVLGAVSSLETIMTFAIRMRKLCNGAKFFDPLNDEEKKRSRCLDGPVTVFVIVWFIVGCFWVFNAYDEVEYDDVGDSSYCDATLYRFSFVIALIGCGTFAFITLVACCCCCCFCVA